MKNLNRYITAALFTSVLAGATYGVQAKESETNDALTVSNAKVSINSAIELALQKVPGIAVAAEYENDDGESVWEVEVLAANKSVHDLTIDAVTGKVLSNKIDSDDHEDKDD